MEKPKINILSLSAKNKSSYFSYLFGQVKYRIKIFFLCPYASAIQKK